MLFAVLITSSGRAQVSPCRQIALTHRRGLDCCCAALLAVVVLQAGSAGRMCPGRHRLPVRIRPESRGVERGVKGVQHGGLPHALRIVFSRSACVCARAAVHSRGQRGRSAVSRSEPRPVLGSYSESQHPVGLDPAGQVQRQSSACPRPPRGGFRLTPRPKPTLASRARAIKVRDSTINVFSQLL